MRLRRESGVQDDRFMTPDILSATAMTHWKNGDFASADHCASLGLELAIKNGDDVNAMWLQLQRGEIRLYFASHLPSNDEVRLVTQGGFDDVQKAAGRLTDYFKTGEITEDPEEVASMIKITGEVMQIAWETLVEDGVYDSSAKPYPAEWLTPEGNLALHAAPGIATESKPEVSVRSPQAVLGLGQAAHGLPFGATAEQQI